MNRRCLILGTGNVAWHLAHGLRGSEVAIWGRHADKAQSIAQSANIAYANTVEDDEHTTVFYAVNDDSVRLLSTRYAFSNATEVHLSGSLPLDALQAPKRMVMWPVLSLVAGEPQDLSAIPWVVQGAHIHHLPSFTMHRVEDDLQRRRMHLAAVVLNNFVHQMGVMVSELLEDTPEDFFNALLRQTTTRMMRGDADKLQTGPARRNDQQSIVNHLHLLNNHKDLKDVYSLFTQIIKKRYGHEL